VAISPGERRVRVAKRALAVRGMVEAVTWSFLARRHAELFGGARPELELANPISADLDFMRPSLLPNLITAVGRNVNRGFAEVALFEVGPRYADDTAQGQGSAAGGVRRGQAGPRHWAGVTREVDVFDAKADALAVLAACGAPVDKAQVERGAPAWYHPGRSGLLMLGPKVVLASFGEIHPAVLAELDVKGPLVGFEVDLDALPKPRAKASRGRETLESSDLPAVERDFAFVVDHEVPASTIVRAVRGAERKLIAEVGLFDVYEGEGIPQGKKSVAVSVRLEPREQTLTEAEIEAIAGRIVAAVEKATGGVLRS
jgi:phenylalanyl-tRNA synthetase beta chain